MSAGSSSWLAYDGGRSVGGLGSEEGMILLDEEHQDGARITLERNARVAPYAITCGMYGWFFHTRFFSFEKEAQEAYAEMKLELDRILNLLASNELDGHQARTAVTNAISDFVQSFPT